MKSNRILGLLIIALGAGLFMSLGALLSTDAEAFTQRYQMLAGSTAKKIGWDHDSGWVALSPAQSLILTHSLGADPEDYVVYTTGRADTTGEVHQAHYGLRTILGGGDLVRGVRWEGCTDTEITVFRGGDDDQGGAGVQWNSVRVRILRNQ
jgi:hypothetical protein